MKTLLLVSLATLSLALGLGASATRQSGLHPAFQCDDVKAVTLYDKGYHDADAMKDLEKPGGLFFKESGRSWIQVISKQYEAYRLGFRAKKAFLEDEKVKAEKDSLSNGTASESFTVIGALAAAPTGAIKEPGGDGKDRYTMPDVRIILKIGDRVYRPRTQPGDLVAEYKSYDYTTTESGSRTVTVSVPNGDGSYHDETTVIPTTDSVRHADAWLTAPLEGTFDLFNEDGTPRILPKDKEMILFLIVGTTQKQFKYKIGDFAKLETLKPPKGDFFKRFKKQ